MTDSSSCCSAIERHQARCACWEGILLAIGLQLFQSWSSVCSELVRKNNVQQVRKSERSARLCLQLRVVAAVAGEVFRGREDFVQRQVERSNGH